MQLAQRFQIPPLGLAAQAAVQQVVHHQADGVHGALGAGGVAGLAPAADADTAVFRLQGDVGGVLQAGHFGLDQGAGPVGDGVVGHAALKLQDLAAGAGRADQLAVEVALLAVADRELGVRGKAERRGLVVGQVVFHVLHAGLLVGAGQGADGVAQLDPHLLEELEGVQSSHHRPLVVHDAAAQDPAVLPAHLEGAGRPALPCGHHVHMADGRQVLVRVCAGQLGIADVALAVMGGKAHPAGQFQRLVQRGAGALPEGRALGGLCLHAVDGHQLCNVLQHLLLVGLYEGVYLLIQFLIHGISFPFCINNRLFNWKRKLFWRLFLRRSAFRRQTAC